MTQFWGEAPSWYRKTSPTDSQRRSCHEWLHGFPDRGDVQLPKKKTAAALTIESDFSKEPERELEGASPD